MHALDIVDVHIWAPSPTAAYREQIRDETSGKTSSVLVLNSPGDGPLTPAFSTQQIGNALDGVNYPSTVEKLSQANQFKKSPTCPADGVFPGHTYCDDIVR
jgi:hypothetical protein